MILLYLDAKNKSKIWLPSKHSRVMVSVGHSPAGWSILTSGSCQWQHKVINTISCHSALSRSSQKRRDSSHSARKQLRVHTGSLPLSDACHCLLPICLIIADIRVQI